MGYYIDVNSNGVRLPARNKADYLITDGGVELKGSSIKFQPNLVCVIENGPFDAAGFCYNQEEFEVFNYSKDFRPKRWIVYPKAAELSGYLKY